MTKAKAAIWTDQASFIARFAKMSDDAKQLVSTISTGTPQDVLAAGGAMTRNKCGACHMAYREADPPKPAS
jgi:cytochrome c556